MNVIDVVTDTLRRAGIISEAETPSAEQGADALTRLNDLMSEWAGVGIDLGWNPKATTAETADIPAEALTAIKANLGVRLTEAYGMQIQPGLVMEAELGYNRLQRQSLLGAICPIRTPLIGEANYTYSRILNG